MANRWGTMETVTDFIFLGSKITADGEYSHEIKRCLLLERKVNDQPRQHIKKQRHYFANKGPPSQGYGFSSGHVWILRVVVNALSLFFFFLVLLLPHSK